jgi:BirA family biotin operon repressor/biotin-[acetyl-CoA-carboxylase] ligase
MSRRVLRLGEVESTNRWAVERFDELAHGLAVVADRQTRGRGRLERSWSSSVAGNLYASLVLKLEPGRRERLPAGFPNLTQYTAVVLARVARAAGADVAIKWPNDLLAGGRKLAGILAQAVSRGREVLGAVVGAGVNLAMREEDLAAIDQPAASLNLVLGRPVERDAFLDAVLDEFFSGYRGFLESGFASIRSEFLALTPMLGREISVNSVHSRITGTACDITEEGSLVVLTPQGRATLTLGDVQ